MEQDIAGEITLTQGKRKSIETILKYTLPTYKAIEHTGDLDLALRITKVEEELIG